MRSQDRDGVLDEFGVWIEEQEVSASRPFGAKIIASGKPKIRLTLEKDHSGKLLLEHFGTTIMGCVVNYDYLDGQGAGNQFHALETTSQKLFRVPIYNYDRDVHALVRLGGSSQTIRRFSHVQCQRLVL